MTEAQRKAELAAQELETQKAKRLTARNEMIGLAQVRHITSQQLNAPPCVDHDSC